MAQKERVHFGSKIGIILDSCLLLIFITTTNIFDFVTGPIFLTQLFPAVEIACARLKELRAVEEELGGLKTTLAGRKLIERAKGVLMDRCGIREEEAFQRMRRFSMERRRSMTDVAKSILQAEEKRRELCNS